MRRGFFLLLFSFFSSAYGQETSVPAPESMQMLAPVVAGRLSLYDSLFPAAGQMGEALQAQYSSPDRLRDLHERLTRMEATGQPMDIFDAQEKIRFQQNMNRLLQLESRFFDQWFLKVPMSLGIQTQKAISLAASPMPTGTAKQNRIDFWRQNRRGSALYSAWEARLDPALEEGTGKTPLTWGDLLQRFSEDEAFRRAWVQAHPETLPKLKKMSEILAWDDSSVRQVKVFHANTPAEYWVIGRDEKSPFPNRFLAQLENDDERLMQIEFAPTLFFNRLTRITTEETPFEARAEVYELYPVEKGRSMQSLDSFDAKGSDKGTFTGAEIIRKTKMDELLQRDLVKHGVLSLFMGLRTMSFHEAKQLSAKYPSLVTAVGQFGFSVTGGQAQTASNRTDGLDQQAAKLTATFMDIVDFAQVTDVDSWFRKNIKHVLRTIVGGVGAGGTSAAFEPGRTSLPAARGEALSCSKIFL